MKILFFSNIPSPYQIEFITELQEYTEIMGYFLRPRGKNQEWHLPVIENCIIANFCYRLSHFKHFHEIFISFNPDIILMGGYALPLSTYALYLCHRHHKPVVHWLERPLPHGPLNHLKRLYARIRLSSSALILAIGEQARQHYQPLFNGPIINFPYNLDLQPYFAIERRHQENETKPAPIKILYSGQFIHRKNVLNLVKAARQVPADHPFQLTLIGSGELETELRLLAKNDQRINLPGFIQPEKLPDIYREHNVFILPGHHDGWGVVITEAMAAAMPIIGTEKIGAVNDYILHKDNGFICETNPQSIASALQYYLQNPKLIYEQGQRNRQIIKAAPVDCRSGSRFLMPHLTKLIAPPKNH